MYTVYFSDSFIANRTWNTTVTMVTVFATREYGMIQ